MHIGSLKTISSAASYAYWIQSITLFNLTIIWCPHFHFIIIHYEHKYSNKRKVEPPIYGNFDYFFYIRNVCVWTENICKNCSIALHSRWFVFKPKNIFAYFSFSSWYKWLQNFYFLRLKLSQWDWILFSYWWSTLE